jgi:hypothetical protein
MRIHILKSLEILEIIMKTANCRKYLRPDIPVHELFQRVVPIQFKNKKTGEWTKSRQQVENDVIIAI